MEEERKSGLGIASLVLGIISIVTSLFWYITSWSGILAIIFGVKSLKKCGSKVRKSRISNRNSWIIIICIYVYKYDVNNYGI